MTFGRCVANPRGLQATVDEDDDTLRTREGGWRSEESIASAIESWQRLKDGRREEQKPWNEPVIRDQRLHQPLEQDFTTKGAQGELKCPFAEKAASQRSRRLASLHQRPTLLPTPPDFKDQLFSDPIAAEFHPDAFGFGSPPASAHDTTTKCPIRFLDDHSPEEIAKYFENHKHEIPRSHEVCVKRYQSNAESIRQLDAKYGSLVNMIQGLGVKHQPMLQSDEGKSSIPPNRKTSEKIEHWAETCADSVPPPTSEHVEDGTSEVRTGHFERPLQEVRLGESPSRPWGIQVPLDKQTAASADPHEIVSNEAQSIPAPVPSSAQANAAGESPARCPFGHGAPVSPSKLSYTKQSEIHHPIRKADTVDQPVPRKPSPSPNVIFNGPVFFGYPPSSMSEMLKALQGSGVP